MQPLCILLATDGSSEAATAVPVLRALALPHGTVIHVLCAREAPAAAPSSGALDELRDFERAACAAAVESAAADLAREGLTITPHVREAPAVDAILAAAAEYGAEMIVLGAKARRGLSRLLLGSVGLAVPRRSQVPVLVTRPLRQELRSVMVAMDESPGAFRAARFLLRLPLPAAAAVTLTHVLEPHEAEPSVLEHGPDAFDAIIAELRCREATAAGALLLEQAQAQPEERRVRLELRVGDPAAEVLEAAREFDVDLVIAGAGTRSPLENLLLGNVADRLLKEAPCSILLVP
jgi:nucleotide-binding universal stress UspA family protein